MIDAEIERAPSRMVAYKTMGDVTLHLHLFEPAASIARPLPAMVFFFGGGWVGGRPQQFFPHCAYLAARGMLAVSAEYRVRDRHGTTPFECVADGKSAVRWLRAHAGELGVDPARIAAGGGSAGGHVAACTGIVPGFDEPGEDVTISSKPDAMVLFNPVVDTTMGQLSERFEGRAEALSPHHYVTPGLPPVVIFHGKDDTTVPYAQIEAFADRMHTHDNLCEVMGFEGETHGFFNYGRDGNVAFETTVAAMDRFLVEQGFLSED